MTTVHFVVPFYGSDELLFATIGSVLESHRDDWVLTVVDDCNPDTEAPEHIRDLADSRLRYVRNEHNLGAGGNLYRSLVLGAASDVSYVTCLGADDLVLPNYVDVVDQAFREHPEAIIVQPGVTVIDEGGRPVNPLIDIVKRRLSSPARRRGEITGEAAVASLLRGNWTYLPSLAFRREAVARTRARHGVDGISDLGHTIDMLMRGGSIALPPDVAFRYRRHAGNHSSTRARNGWRFEEERTYYREVAAELRSRGWHRAARAADRHLMSRLHRLVMTARG